MAVIGKIPEFTTEETADPNMPVVGGDKGQEEVKEASPTSEEKPKETVAQPPGAEIPPSAEMPRQDNSGGEAKVELERAVLGLRNEREKLLHEVTELKGKRREIKQEELIKVQEKIDELADVNPDDVSLINRVLRAKGFITKEEASRMWYDSVKNDTLAKFLDRYPEYKPENDTNDIHWGSLQREMSLYRMPDDPHKIIDILERAHKNLGGTTPTIERTTQARKRQIEVASVGSGGITRSSSSKSLDPSHRLMLEQGGWTKEEITRIEKGL